MEKHKTGCPECRGPIANKIENLWNIALVLEVKSTVDYLQILIG
jgi:hypothetical protein